MTRFETPAEDVAKRLRDGMVGGVLVLPAHELPGGWRSRSGGVPGLPDHPVGQRAGRGVPGLRHRQFFSLDEDEYRAVVRATVEIATDGCRSSRASATAGRRPCASPGSRRRRRTPRWYSPTTRSPPRRTGWWNSCGGSPPAPLCRSSPTSAARSPTACAGSRISRRSSASRTTQRPDRLQRLTLAAPDGFLFFNGASTAEIQARAYATVGVPAYSSAVHAFAPEIANAFFAALRDGDDAGVTKLLRDFYVPLVELRDRVPGYAVSLVKAAAGLRGLPVGRHACRSRTRGRRSSTRWPRRSTTVYVVGAVRRPD